MSDILNNMISRLPDLVNCIDINNEFAQKYLTLVSSEDTDQYTEIHHIVPVAYFRDVLQEGDVRKNRSPDMNPANLVKLSKARHLLAHYYLSQCALESIKNQMETAFCLMFQVIDLKTVSEKDVIDKAEEINRYYQKLCTEGRAHKDGEQYITSVSGTSYANWKDGTKVGVFARWNKDSKIVSLGDYDKHFFVDINRDNDQITCYHWKLEDKQWEIYISNQEYNDYKSYSLSIRCDCYFHWSSQEPSVFYIGDFYYKVDDYLSLEKLIRQISPTAINSLLSIKYYLNETEYESLCSKIHILHIFILMASDIPLPKNIPSFKVDIPHLPTKEKNKIARKRKKKTGVFEKWQNGKIISRTTYENGIKHGRYESYNDDGSLFTVGEYVNGRKEGKWTTDKVTENINTSYMLRFTCIYHEDIYNGEYDYEEICDEIDQFRHQRETGLYKNGLKQGTWFSIYDFYDSAHCKIEYYGHIEEYLDGEIKSSKEMPLNHPFHKNYNPKHLSIQHAVDNGMPTYTECTIIE